MVFAFLRRSSSRAIRPASIVLPSPVEFANAPQRQPGHHILEVENWTRDGRGAPGTIFVLWEGNETFYWETGTGKMANFSRAEIHKVYDAWRDYLGGRLGRSSIRRTVFNSKPIISLLKKFEHLMY
jgi:hypothetical protein